MWVRSQRVPMKKVCKLTDPNELSTKSRDVNLEWELTLTLYPEPFRSHKRLGRANIVVQDKTNWIGFKVAEF
jgi:hypothetical protein